MADEEDVLIEIEAAISVYGDDCTVLDNYPPLLHVHIKPRTADVSSQQFVEAVIEIRAGPQYPDEPPCISIVDSKGLDEERQKHLITSIHEKACELSSYSMLVALCEEAVERLSSMNHPDGECPLCLSPLVEEGAETGALPFMKLMSCFHCFHCDCIIRWWNWLQKQKETDPSGSSASVSNVETQQGMHGGVDERMGTCPVCRKVFHVKDIEHVLDLVGSYSELSLDDAKVDNDDVKLLLSDSENIRREKFEAALKLQQENNGLIEPKKTEVLMPGMFLPRPILANPAPAETEASEQQNYDPANPTPPDTETSKQQNNAAVNPETNTSGSSYTPSTNEHKSSSGMRRHHRGRYGKHPHRGGHSNQARDETSTIGLSDKQSTNEHRNSSGTRQHHQGRYVEHPHRGGHSDQARDETNTIGLSDKQSTNEYRNSSGTRQHHQGRYAEHPHRGGHSVQARDETSTVGLSDKQSTNEYRNSSGTRRHHQGRFTEHPHRGGHSDQARDETNTISLSDRRSALGTNEHRNSSGMRRHHRGQNSRPKVNEWVVKENYTAS